MRDGSKCHRVNREGRESAIALQMMVPIWRRYRSADPNDSARAALAVAANRFDFVASALRQRQMDEIKQVRQADYLVLARAMAQARDAFLGLIDKDFVEQLRYWTVWESNFSRFRGPPCLRGSQSTRASVFRAAAAARWGAELMRRVALRDRHSVGETELRLLAPSLKSAHRAAEAFCLRLHL
jgi:hypothetical protein